MKILKSIRLVLLTAFMAGAFIFTVSCKSKGSSNPSGSEAKLKLTSLKIFGQEVTNGTLEVENDKSELNSSDIEAVFDYANVKSKNIAVNVSNGTLDEGENKITLSIPAAPTLYKAWSKEITITRKGKYTKVKFSELKTYLENTAQSTEGAKENCIEISDLTEDDLKIWCYNDGSLAKIIENSGKKIELKLSGTAITEENIKCWPSDYKNLKSIDLSECPNLKNIKKHTFSGCWGLESFKASPDLESIGENAFKGCINLKTVDLSQYPKLTTISPFAFYQCSYLETVNLNACSKLETIGEGAFSDCKRLKSIDLSGCENIKKIGQIAFKECEKLENIDLSKCTKLEFIGKGAFAKCTKLTRADLSGLAKLKTLGSIEDYDFGLGIFEACSNLSEIKLDGCSSIEEICEKAFYACENLGRIDLSSCSKLKKLGLPYNVPGKINGVFEACSNLTEIKLDGASLKEICENTFKDCKKLSAIDLSTCSQLSKIEKNMFENCKEIESITLPDTITEIGGSAFQNCAALNKIDLSKLELTSIGGQAFYGCESIETINLSKSIELTNLGGYAPFYACTSLKSIDLSNCTKLNLIGASGFYRCENLESLDLAHCKNLKEIKSDTFVDCENLTVRLPDSITEIAKGAFGDPDKCYNGNCQTRCKKVRVPNDDIKTKVVNANYPEENIEL